MLTKVSGGWAAAAMRLFILSAVAVSGVSVEARAADDGQAPLWEGLSSVVGIGKPDEPNIDYRERSKLVLPPKIDLPPPGVAGRASAAWPTDQEIQKARKLKALRDAPAPRNIGKVSTVDLGRPGQVVTMSATAGYGPGGGACLKDGFAVACPTQPIKGVEDHPSRQLEWNPLVWVGVQQKKEIVLGPEPDRDFLTDPPQGLRTPAEGVGAKIKNN
jgi:hypothetical protein